MNKQLTIIYIQTMYAGSESIQNLINKFGKELVKEALPNIIWDSKKYDPVKWE